MRGKLPPGVTLLPPKENETEITRDMRRFDQVDRNLIREGVGRMIDLLQEVGGAGFKAYGSESDMTGPISSGQNTNS